MCVRCLSDDEIQELSRRHTYILVDGETRSTTSLMVSLDLGK